MYKKLKLKRKKRKYLSDKNDSSKEKTSYLLFLIKLIFISFLLFQLFKFSNSIKETTIFQNNNNYSEYSFKYNYSKEFIEFTSQFSKDELINPLLKNISIISIDYTESTRLNNILKVHISLNLDNNYVYQALVSMESALHNSNKNNSTYILHILCAGDILEQNIIIMKSLLNKYKENLAFIFYNMSDTFIHHKKEILTHITYYRLLLPVMIPYDRIIYLDNDILVFKDLTEMYQLSFNDSYVLGNLDMLFNGLDYLGIKSDKYINGGVLLLNLDKIRKDKKHIDIIEMGVNHQNLKNHDQTVINYVLYPNINLLPFKYGVFNFQSESDIEKIFMKMIRQKIDVNEFIKAFRDPGIIHFLVCHPKVWGKNPTFSKRVTLCKQKNDCDCSKYHDMWYEFAKNTSYYEEIINKYK